MTTIQTDVDTELAFNAEDAFLARWKDADEDQPSDETVEEAKDDNKETPEEVDPSEKTDEANEANETDEDEELLEDPDDTTDEVPAKKDNAAIAADDLQVVFTVDGKEQQVSVKELKRLAGQEAALTRKSQETAEERKVVETEKAKYSTALNTMQKRAEDKYRPYAQIDFLVASKQLDAEEFEALRKEALAAYEDYKFYTEELTNFKGEAEQGVTKEFVEKASKAIQTLSNPETGIPGWSQELYNEIRTFAVEKNGMDIETVNKVTDPAIIKMMWKAMRYDRAKKVSTKKIAAGAKKVVKTVASSETSTARKTDQKALDKLRETGSRDAAVDALTARWADED